MIMADCCSSYLRLVSAHSTLNSHWILSLIERGFLGDIRSVGCNTRLLQIHGYNVLLLIILIY